MAEITRKDPRCFSTVNRQVTANLLLIGDRLAYDVNRDDRKSGITLYRRDRTTLTWTITRRPGDIVGTVIFLAV